MTEQKEFESLDDLFRKTFDNLPEKPAASGWDTPSEKVWQHVRQQIKPPHSGWSTQMLTLLAAFAVTLTVGLYLYFNRTAQPETPAAVQAPVVAESAEMPSVNTREQAAEIPASAPETPAVPQKSSKTPKTTNSRKSGQAEAAKSAVADSSADKPAEIRRKVPNTTLRLKAELAKRAEEAWKKPLDPLPQRWPKKPKN